MLVEASALRPLEELLDGLDERRIADDASFTIDDLGELVECLQAVTRARFGHVGLGPLAGGRTGAAPQLFELGVDVAVGVPHGEVRHCCERVHGGAILVPERQQHLGALLGRVPVVASRDGEAGGEPLDVPLPGAREGLVEVVDAELQPPLRGREHSEVHQVGVTTDLCDDPRTRCAGEVGRHDERGSPIERERRHEHAAIADRDQLRHPAHGLLLQQRHRVRSVRSGREACMARSGHLASRCLAPRHALLHGQVGDHLAVLVSHTGCNRRRLIHIILHAQFLLGHVGLPRRRQHTAIHPKG